MLRHLTRGMAGVFAHRVDIASQLDNRKGVACRIVEPEHMPYDEFGNRVDLAVYGPGCVARLNPGQLYSQYGGAVKRDQRLRMLAARDNGVPWETIWAGYLDFLSVISPPTHESARSKSSQAAQQELERIYQYGIVTLDTSDNGYIGPQWVRELRASYPPNKGRLWVHNENGDWEQTNCKVLIGPVPIIFLDKSDFKSMAVAVARLNNFRLPSTQNKATKVSRPVNTQAPRFGEDEFRSANAVATGKSTLDHIELSTNPEATAMYIRKAWTTDAPFQMRGIIDRNVIPYGSGVNVAFAKHLIGIVGLETKIINEDR